MGKDSCTVNISIKIYSLIDKLVKKYVSKIFIIGDIRLFGLACLTDEP